MYEDRIIVKLFVRHVEMFKVFVSWRIWILVRKVRVHWEMQAYRVCNWLMDVYVRACEISGPCSTKEHRGNATQEMFVQQGWTSMLRCGVRGSEVTYNSPNHRFKQYKRCLKNKKCIFQRTSVEEICAQAAVLWWLGVNSFVEDNIKNNTKVRFIFSIFKLYWQYVFAVNSNRVDTLNLPPPEFPFLQIIYFHSDDPVHRTHQHCPPSPTNSTWFARGLRLCETIDEAIRLLVDGRKMYWCRFYENPVLYARL
jgi:hypothetical protein